MFRIMDCLSEVIYIINIENYELLYINAAGKELFHVDDCRGKICYEVLQGLESPCSFCTNDLICYDNYYTWEYTNPLINRHFLLRDRKIKWKGLEAKVEIAFDITEKEQQKILLEHALEAQTVIMECISHLYDTKDLGRAINNVLKRIGNFLMAERAYIFEIRNGRMFNTHEWCAEGVVPQRLKLQDLDARLIEQWLPYFSSKECMIIKNIEEINRRNPEAYRLLGMQGINSMVIAPLYKEEKLTGYMGVDNPPLNNIQNISDFFQTLRYFLMSSMRIAENEKQLIKLSYHDVLTNAFNRNRYLADVESLLLQNLPIGVVYLDINGLKEMNDSLGHAFGDAMIKECAKRATEVFTGYKLYRIGGDEFVILCSGIEEGEFYRRSEILKSQFRESGRCMAAVGCRWSYSSKNLRLLEEEADEMMYQNKEEYYKKFSILKGSGYYKKDHYGMADPKRLRKQLKEGRFSVYFQPEISLADGKITGAEALVRYETREGMMIGPEQFLPVLESLHLISQMDYYVFETVCSKINDWTQNGRQIIPISVNISGISLEENGFIEKLGMVCRRYAIEQEWLKIEVAGHEEIQESLAKLRKSGFSITLDRFGAFSANLAPIMTTDYAKIKVDRSLVPTLVKNNKMHAVLRALIMLCRELKITASAGGIEEKEELEIFKSLGFDEIQGYFISRPLPDVSFEEQYIKSRDLE